MSCANKPVRVLYSFPHKLGAGRICYTAWQQVAGLAAAGANVLVFPGVLHRPLPGDVVVQPTLARGRWRIPYKLLGTMRACALRRPAEQPLRLQAPFVPHMGWNTVAVPEGSTMFAGVEGERFYFVHSYGVRRWELETHGRTRPPLVTWTEHGGDRFVSAVENGPLWATQFHPEKSGDAGAQLLRNWVGSL